MMSFPKLPRGLRSVSAGRIISGIRLQRGSTLLVGLIMLVLLTLVAVSAINSTTTSVQTVGNAQFRQEATAAAQKAIETVISTGDFRNATPPAQTVNVNGVANYTVNFDSPAPRCVSFTPVDPTDPTTPPQCASSIGAVCFWTVWDVTAVVADPVTGARVAIHQGVRTIAGLNVGVASCMNN